MIKEQKADILKAELFLMFHEQKTLSPSMAERYEGEEKLKKLPKEGIFATLFAAVGNAKDKKTEQSIVKNIREAVDLGYKNPETFALPTQGTKNQVAITK